MNEHLRHAADLLVLSVLSDNSLYGYAISKRIAAQSHGQVNLSPGVLYPLLHRMEKQGLLSASWETVQADDRPESPGRRRKWYRISAKGRRKLQQRIAAHRAYLAVLDSFLPNPGEQTS